MWKSGKNLGENGRKNIREKKRKRKKTMPEKLKIKVQGGN